MHQTENEIKKVCEIGTAKLDGKARAVIDLYLALPMGSKPSCPYFNNRRTKSKSQLRVLKGKGSPEEIVEETEINAKQERVDIASLPADKLKEFIVSQNLGVDCSGFAYHVLDALAHERRGKSLKRFIKTNRGGFIGSFMFRLRPAENMGVATFANDKNSFIIDASKARPGDIITIVGTGKDGLYNHIMVITGVEDNRILYAHSYAWPSDGSIEHGVREGEITVPERCGRSFDINILTGIWTEKGSTGADNYTYESAKTAREVSVRRLRFLA